LKRLDFVLRARGLGFPLDSVRGLLDLADGEGRSCAQVERIAFRHLKDVRNKLADILVMEKVLAEMVAECRGGTMPACPLIEALFNED